MTAAWVSKSESAFVRRGRVGALAHLSPQFGSRSTSPRALLPEHVNNRCRGKSNRTIRTHFPIRVCALFPDRASNRCRSKSNRTIRNADHLPSARALLPDRASNRCRGKSNRTICTQTSSNRPLLILGTEAVIQPEPACSNHLGPGHPVKPNRVVTALIPRSLNLENSFAPDLAVSASA